MRKCHLALGTVVASIFATSGIGVTETSAKELKLAHFMPPVHVLHREAFEPLAKEIEQSTKGDLTIKIFPAGQLGAGPVQQYKRAIDGVADISFVVVQYVSTIFPRTMLLTLPGVADSAVEATEKAWRIYEPLLKSEYSKIKMLGIWANSPTSLIAKKPIRTPADLKGLKVRSPSPVASDYIQAWGGVPVNMEVSATYQAFETGVVDAVWIAASAAFKPWNLAEPGEYVIDNIPGSASMFFLAMNQQSWDGLSAGQKAALDKATGKEFSRRAGVAFGREDVEALEKSKNDPTIKYLKISDEERAQFQKSIGSVIEKDLAELESKGINGREVYKALTK